MRRPYRDAWTIALKDATETWRDGRFRWASAILLTILGVAFASGWSHTASLARARDEAQRAERAMWLDKGAMNPHAAAHYGAFVFKPVEPLSAVDAGVDPIVGPSVFLEAHQQELAPYQAADDASALRRLSDVTPALALQVLAPLVIVLATAHAFAAEREQGTLRQVMSVGVARGSLAAGKLAGAVLPLTLVLIPGSVIGSVAMVWNASAALDRDAVVRTVWLVAAYLAYFGIWVGLGLFVSARARSSMAALAVLLGLWFASTLLAPPMAMFAAKALHPAPLSGAFVRAIEQGRADLPRWDRRVEQVEERFLSGELELAPGMPSNPEVIALVEAEHEETALYDRHFEHLFRAHVGQASTYARLGGLVPTLAVQSISMALAGTDYAHYHGFVDAARAYRRTFLQTLNAELASYQQLDTFDYARGREFWAGIPELAYEAPPALTLLAAHRASLGALAAWLLAIGLLLAWALRTLRVG